MAPFKSSAGRNLGKLVQGYLTRDIGNGLGVASPTSTSLYYLIIGGGGAGGGSFRGGGGGAGAYLTNWNDENQGGGQSSGFAINLSPGDNVYNLKVGTGGVGAPGADGGYGNDSIFGSFTAPGGGGGAYYQQDSSPSNGSSGGASSPLASAGTSGTYGYPGGDGGDSQQGGGGGGAGGAGNPGSPDNPAPATAGDGGLALASTITGSSVLRAGGGGGGSYGTGNNFAVGGGGGAGDGIFGASPYLDGNPYTIQNTGSGGGGASGDGTGTGGDGADGVVILRYPNATILTTPANVTSSTSLAGDQDQERVTTFTSTNGGTESITLTLP